MWSKMIFLKDIKQWLLILNESAQHWTGAMALSGMQPMQRGEVWWVDFDPAMGGEIQKIRPAVIVSNNAANATLNRI